MQRPSPRSCFILGEGSLIVRCALTLRERGMEIRGIATRDASVSRWAEGEAIPVLQPGDLAFSAMRATPFDYLFSIVNLEILPDEIVSLPRRMAVNFHDGPLPRYAGINAPSWALIEGEREYGVTWHGMTKGADRGRILSQEMFALSDEETAFSLNARCFDAGMRSFEVMVDGLLSDSLEMREQDSSQRTYFAKFQRPEAASLIDFAQDADAIGRFVAAHDYGHGFPNPFGLPKILVGERVLYVTRAEATVEASTEPPGTIISADARGLLVAAGDVNVSLSGLTCPLGSVPAAAELAAWGFRPGERLEAGPREALTESTAASVRGEADRVAALRALAPVRPGSAAADQTGRTGQTGQSELPEQSGRTGHSEHPGHSDRPAELVAAPGPPRSFDAGKTGDGRAVAAALLAFLARISGQESVSVSLDSPLIEAAAAGIRPFVFTRVPVTADVAMEGPAGPALEALERKVSEAEAAGPLPRDLFLRYPDLQRIPRDDAGVVLPISVRLGAAASGAPASGSARGTTLEPSVDADGAVNWRHDPARLSTEDVASLQRQFATFLAGLDEAPSLATVPLVDNGDRRLLLEEWKGPALDFPLDATIHGLIEAQARATPDAAALTFRGRTLTYREVDAQASRIARHLQRNGVGPDVLVGIYMERSAEMVIGALAVMKAEGAYLPLDPEYPAERIRFMIEDSGAPAILTQERVRGRLPKHDALVVSIDGDEEKFAERSESSADQRATGNGATPDPDPGVTSADLAYVIYTSGSTGQPKGVMVEHRNVVSFFAGMDDRLDFEPGVDAPGRWLAVTSLNFDISVLELFWTLARGFEVVIHAEQQHDDCGEGKNEVEAGFIPRHPERRIDFGAFYFSSDEGEGLENKYQLLIEGAKFADRNGFNSVWTPERHFHAFGGLFPNPAVTSAALATITEHVQLRAGSCVSPLHSPIRIAEDWSVVDNLSGGRVGISFAAGWQPNDFVIRPEGYADRRDQMFRDIDTVKALWRGESIAFPNGEGKEVETRILPRPVSKELNVWVTAAGNPETFREAGAKGANLLTHLLGQTIGELTEKIEIYRKARAEAGHSGRGIVSLMLHSYVGETDEVSREVVREPMKAYLRSAVGLVKSAAWSFPTFRKTTTMEDGSFGIDHLSDEDMDALLNYAFERYYDSAGLFGGIDSCVRFVDGIKGADVDEIACLIDFGIPTPVVLEALPRLAEVLRAVNAGVAGGVRDSGVEHSHVDHSAIVRSEGEQSNVAHSHAESSIPALIARHGITHFQCTPSQLALLLADEDSASALSALKKVMIGGEALPAPLARDLETRVRGDVLNMYGPTETTIWSSTHPVRDIGETVPIGRPIANTRIVILDAKGELLPPGAQGELCIGGPGVTRGYLGRPEITAERFIPDRFAETSGSRLYRTGDLARFRSDGTLEFRGRLDSQVKLRGHRIELGEIEARLAEHPGIKAAVAIVREDTPGDQRIVAYLVPGATAPEPESVRAHLAERLPGHMIPSAFVFLDHFPETPNRKIDRKALPAPEAGRERRPATAEFVQPSSEIEKTIADIWCEVLGVQEVGSDDNFFDLGGHSLLTIQVQGRLRECFDRPVSLVDLFRFTTVRALAGFLGGTDDKEDVEASAERGAGRRDAMARRRATRRK